MGQSSWICCQEVWAFFQDCADLRLTAPGVCILYLLRELDLETLTAEGLNCTWKINLGLIHLRFDPTFRELIDFQPFCGTLAKCTPTR